MKTFDQLPGDQQGRMAEASAWQMRLADDPALEVSEAFQTWLADPMNEQMFEGVHAAWKATEDFAVDPQLLDMRQAALRRVRAASVQRWSPRRAARRIAAAAVMIAVIGGGLTYDILYAPDVYTTSVGERRTVVLSDGSQIALDSDTQVEVQYLKNARELQLDRGRARFDVAHDIARPFSVAAGDETVVAVGTSFDVEKIGPRVMVTLIRGKIVVKDAHEQQARPEAQAPVRSVSLRAGQELVAAVDVKPTIKAANLDAASAWQSGRLVFSGDTLGDAVARENRYTHHPMEVDSKIASIRIVGAFNAGDVSSFVSAITSYFPVQATTTTDDAILLQPRS